MTKITEMNRANARMLGDAIAEALQGVAEEFGVQIKAGGGSFDFTSLTQKVEVSIINEDGEAETKEATAFRMNADSFPGLSPDDLYKTFVCKGEIYKIMGLRPRAHTRHILCKTKGKLYTFRAQDVVRLLRVSGKATAA